MSLKVKKILIKYKNIFIILGLLFFLPIAYYILQFINRLGKYLGFFMRNIYEIVTTFL